MRICSKDWKIPEDDFVIPKDMSVIIPIVSKIMWEIITLAIKSFRLDFIMTLNTGKNL